MFQQTSGREATPYVDPGLERERELVLLDWVGTTANDAWSLTDALEPVLGRVCEHAGWPIGHAYLLPRGSAELIPSGVWSLEEPGTFESFRRVTDATTFAAGEGLPGRVLASGEPAWIADFSGDANFARAEAAGDVGLRAAIAFPVLTGAEAVGVLEFFTDAGEEPDPSLLRLMAQVGKQLGRVVERERSREHIAHSTMHDSLTGLPTRALFLDRLAHAHARASRNGLGLVVLLVDVDDFQAVNRRIGHEGGDKVLAEVGRRLRAAVRASDAVARLGADQFAVLCEDAGAESPVRVIDRIGAALGEPVKVDGHQLVVTASLGVSSGSAQPDDPVTLLREAETALEAAKSCGKDRCAVFNVGMRGRDRLRERDEIEALLEREGSIVPVFQPIVDLRTGIVAGYEALARFRASGPSRPPNLWFAQAYRCGLGVQLEAQGLRSILAVPREGAGAYLSVNLTPTALMAAEIRALLPDDLSNLVLEVTENQEVEDARELDRSLAEVRSRGARIAVDDMGSGYAGLRHLMDLRPDLIKLDRAMVNGVRADVAKQALIDSVVGYARRFEASVCAEGIESLDDLLTLADLDVTYGQGYALARPGPPWAGVAPAAVEACSSSLTAALRRGGVASGPSPENADHRLEALARAVFDAGEPVDMDEAMRLVAAELHADEVYLSCAQELGGHLETVSRYGRDLAGARFAPSDFPLIARVLDTKQPVQVLVSDPQADRAEVELMLQEDKRSLLMLPIFLSDRGLGLLEAYSREERPWSRTEIHRARVICYLLGARLDAFRLPADARQPWAATWPGR